MGKKNTKTAKQKANRAAKKLTQSFAKKLGVSSLKPKLQNGIVVDAAPATPNAHNHAAPFRKEGGSVGSAKAAAAGRAKAKARRGRQRAALMKAKRRDDGGEQQDFENERRSLHERHRVMESKSPGGGKRGFAPNPSTFDPVKSTSQLLRETTEQIQSIGFLGSSSQQWPHSLGQQQPLTAALPRGAWAGSEAPTPVDRNPWSTLNDGDSDDSNDEGTSTRQSPPPRLFHFAPPTFLPQGAGAAPPADLDYDPDL